MRLPYLRTVSSCMASTRRACWFCEKDAGEDVADEKGKGCPSVQGIAEGLGDVAVAGDGGQLDLGPCLEGFRFRAGFGLTDGMPGIAGRALDLALDVIKITDPVQRFVGDLGFGGVWTSKESWRR